MSRYTHLIILPLLLMASGCSQLFLAEEEWQQRIDHDIAQHDYRSAESSLRQLPEQYRNLPAFAQRRLTLKQQQKQYERELLRQAEGLGQRGEFVSADKLYREALIKLPDGTPVGQAYRAFQQRNHQHLQQVRLESQMIRARYLIDTLNLHRRYRASLTTPPLDAATLQRYQDEAIALAVTLQRVAQQAISRDDYAMATTTITLAQRLDPHNREVAKGLALLRQRADAIAEHVSKLKREAAGYYGSENYTRALTLWEEAQVLAPDDPQLTARIARVRRVLASLQQIQHNLP